MMTPFELNYPGTLNRGPFRSFSDVLMSAAYCCTSVLANGRFVFADLVDRGPSVRERLIERTAVLPDPRLGVLSCRIEIALDDGTVVGEEVHNGGEQLALSWDTIDDWARGLWRDACRDDAQYAAVRTAVRDLSRTPAAALFGALAL